MQLGTKFLARLTANRRDSNKHGEMRGWDTGHLPQEDKSQEHLALKTNGA